jgi:Hemerythrin HHE cation binding domain
MTPGQIRTELLREHDEIRLMVEMTQETVRRARSDRAARSELSAGILRLAHALRTHNRFEEEVLRELLAEVDAWGPVRVEIMDAQHASEHRLLMAALIDAGAAMDSTRFVEDIVGPLDRVLAHMAIEEEGFLGDGVLRDDGVVTDQSDG